MCSVLTLRVKTQTFAFKLLWNFIHMLYIPTNEIRGKFNTVNEVSIWNLQEKLFQVSAMAL